MARRRPDADAIRSAVPRVLIADDQPDVLEALRLLLKGEGDRIESAGSPAAILEAIDGGCLFEEGTAVVSAIFAFSAVFS